MRTFSLMLIAIAWTVPAVAGDASSEYPMRAWTDTKGRVVTARYAPERSTDLPVGHVALLSQSGKILKVRLSMLSAEDQAWIASATSVESPATAPMAVSKKTEPAKKDVDEPVTPAPKRVERPQSINPVFW